MNAENVVMWLQKLCGKDENTIKCNFKGEIHCYFELEVVSYAQ